MRPDLAVLMNFPLVSFSNIVSGKHSRAEATLQHKLVIMFGSDVAEQQLFVFKNLKREIFEQHLV